MWYLDTDADGFGSAGSSYPACTAPPAYVADATDCDDTTGGTYPGASEVCDGADNDCDGDMDEGVLSTFHADADADGFGDPTSVEEACAASFGYAADASDCDDTDGTVNPAGVEVCDGADNDCDGAVDENDAVDIIVWYIDTDGDGYGNADIREASCSPPFGYVSDATDCDDGDAAFNPGADESDCADPTDYNCDGSTQYADADTDGYAACEDCDDADATVNPAGIESCNTIDDDCDGTIDEDAAVDAAVWFADTDGDGYGDHAVWTGACSVPSGYVEDDTDCDDATAVVNPGADEVCNDVDDDCDGETDGSDASDVTVWYIDADSDGYGDSTVTDSACDAASDYVSDDTDCDDADAMINPGAEEVCEYFTDEDCDGTIDEDVLTTWYEDFDGDGFGSDSGTVQECGEPGQGYAAVGGDCDDLYAYAYPGFVEVCDDGIDNDCDGDIDESTGEEECLDI
jgi:hypothetical protein